MNALNSPLVNKLIDLAIEEDLCQGDITSQLLPDSRILKANIIAREDLVICGLPITEVIAKRAGYSINVKNIKSEGLLVSAKTVIQEIKGRAAELTSIERIVLNFLQRMSGVATYTRKIVQNASGNITILDTRKTMPGFRILDKYATSVGGAKNHRMNLGDMILIKNNHIDASPGSRLAEKIKNLMTKVNKKRGFYIPVQVEIRNLEELKYVLDYSPYAVLLDNMKDDDIARCIALIKTKSPKTLCEVSGGVEPSRIKGLSKLGVDSLSMGRLTTKATNVDISMRIQLPR